MYLYFILQGKVCDCDVSAVDCSVVRGTRWVRQRDFCGFWYSGSYSRCGKFNADFFCGM